MCTSVLPRPCRCAARRALLPAVVALVALTAAPAWAWAADVEENALQRVSASSIAGTTGTERLDLGFVPVRLAVPEIIGQTVAFTLQPGTVVEAGTILSAVRPGDMRTSTAELDAARWVAAEAGSEGDPLDRPGQLNSLAAEYAARQGAIWALTGEYDLEAIPVPEVADRARFLVDAAAVAVPLETNYPTSYGLQLHEVAQHLATVDVAITLGTDLRRAAGGGGLEGQLVTVSAPGAPTIARITSESAGTVLSLQRPEVDQDYVAHWSTDIPPGLVLEPDAPASGAVVAGGPLRFEARSGVVHVASGSMKELPAIGLNNVIADLSTGSRFWYAALILICVATLGLTLIEVATKHFSDARNAALALLVLVVGGGVFANSQWPHRPLTTPAFERARYGDPAYLPQPDAAGATSAFKQRGLCFGAWRAVDGDDRTAWISRAGRGEGQMLVLDLGRPYWLTGMRITNGFAANYYDNGRVRGLQLIVDGGFLKFVSPLESPEEENMTFEEPYLLTQRLVLRVSEQTSGFNSAALGELRLYGFAADERDSARHAEAEAAAEAPGYSYVMRQPQDDCGRPVA